MNAFSFLAVGLGAMLGAWSRWLLGLALNPLFVMLPPQFEAVEAWWRALQRQAA